MEERNVLHSRFNSTVVRSGSACLLFYCGLEKTVLGNVRGPCIFYREFLVFLERTGFFLRKGTSHCKLNECLQIKIRVLIFMPTTQNQSVLNKISRSYSAVIQQSCENLLYLAGSRHVCT